jgi:DeoR family transcriptional regulator, fructose operon transcriptional repressor
MQAHELLLESSRQNQPLNGALQPTELVLNGSLPARRRIELIRLAQREGQLSIAQLSSQFGVSPDTIRRDLDLLSGHGLVRRTHGGAVASDCLPLTDGTSPQRVGQRIAEKTRIAQCAAELIENDETLLLNGGSTTQLFASELVGKKNLTVVTNSFAIPPAVPLQAVRDLIFIGGEYRPESNTTVGTIAFCGAIAVNAATAIIGVGGIAQDGLYTSLLQDAGMTASMIGHARRTIVLADSSKFGRKLLGHVASLERIDVLVTDSAPPRDLMSTLVQLNVQVIVAPLLNASRAG